MTTTDPVSDPFAQPTTTTTTTTEPDPFTDPFGTSEIDFTEPIITTPEEPAP